MGDKYDCLKISNQLCFPLYACSKEIVKRYKPYLDPIDLTYTQYITMMVIWEEKEITVKALGDKLFLDSGTLTPVLKKLEQKGYVKRSRSKDDERNLIITLTKDGEELKKQASAIPAKMGKCVSLSPEESEQLYKLLYKILGTFEQE
ncbi:MarR family transcriptional regulator [Butyrivibrio fibrisolvens]|uniref:MarR family winged helix-turn-helix transcriptional regulator n=1 Tax=Pseudobutyrivibrio ruminis TaxID=46206 RepID=UPI0004092625|nr:MarR family transcriptional regulator [Pseudobutyrivibrio ruminis]MDC7278599.1 MarR family transcriptional regulator [Butyrivibrio fibrisolvens]